MTAFLPVASNIDLNARVYDNLYQTSSNMLESASRVLNSRSSKISLGDKNFGNVVRMNLPHGNLLLSHTSLTLKIKKTDVPANAFLAQDWIYRAIRYVEFQMGNSEKLRYEGKHLLIKNLADCESGEKKKVLQNVAGEVKKTAAADAPTSAGSYSASCTIYLPFSNMSSSRVLPYDSSILSSPVEVLIELAPADQVFSYTSADSAVVRPLLPREYQDAYISCKTQYMVDGSSDSIRDMVSIRGNEKYTYGYIYPQTFTDSKVKKGVAASENGKVSVNLTRFLNASLQSIDVFVERLTLGNTSGTPVVGVDPDRPMSDSVQPDNLYVPISNIQLLYAGQPIYRSDDESNVLENLSEYPTSTTFDIESYNYSQATAPVLSDTASMKTGYWTHIQLSQFNERYFTNLAQTGVAMNSNEVLLEFNTPEKEDLETFGATISIQPTYRVFAIYNYQAAVRTAKSETNLVFQPPLQSLPSVSGISGTF